MFNCLFLFMLRYFTWKSLGNQSRSWGSSCQLSWDLPGCCYDFSISCILSCSGLCSAITWHLIFIVRGWTISCSVITLLQDSIGGCSSCIWRCLCSRRSGLEITITMKTCDGSKQSMITWNKIRFKLGCTNIPLYCYVKSFKSSCKSSLISF